MAKSDVFRVKNVYGGTWVRRTLLCVSKVAIMGKPSILSPKKLLGPLWDEECLPWCAVCLWALMYALYKYSGTKMK